MTLADGGRRCASAAFVGALPGVMCGGLFVVRVALKSGRQWSCRVSPGGTSGGFWSFKAPLPRCSHAQREFLVKRVDFVVVV
jgi:hypothetical protein